MPQSSAHPTASYTPGSGQRSIGVAVIGAGERGIYYVGSRMAELARETGFRIVAVHDRLPERAQMAARHLNAIYASQGLGPLARPAVSLAEAVSDPQVDLVIVTTHTNAHLEPVRVAAAAGKRIYLDKPISVSLADARGIVAIEAESGQPIMMGFTRRYERPWIEAIGLKSSRLLRHRSKQSHLAL